MKYDFSYDLHVPSSQARPPFPQRSRERPPRHRRPQRLSATVGCVARRGWGRTSAAAAAARAGGPRCRVVAAPSLPRLVARRASHGPPAQVDHEIPTTTGKFRDLLLTPVSVAKEVARIVRRQPDDSTRAVSILKDCKGALLPGTMTLLVAPPGHGKTSFLKALAGRLPAGSLSGRCGPRPRQRGFRGASAALVHRVAPAHPALAR